MFYSKTVIINYILFDLFGYQVFNFFNYDIFKLVDDMMSDKFMSSITPSSD